MAGDALEPTNVGRSERRGSLGRALEKLKTAMRRKGSSGPDVPTLATTSIAAGAMGATNEAAETSTTEPEASTEPQATTEGPSARASTPTDPTPIHADDGTAIDSEDYDEPLLPMLSSRTGISEEKSRLLFEKYGLAYEPRRRSNEHDPPSKLRRVEKPVRIRIHWECHECHNHFARDKTCVSCGHRRCPDCTRAPAKRVKEIMASTKQSMDQEAQQEAVPSTVSQERDATVITGLEDNATKATVPSTASQERNVTVVAAPEDPATMATAPETTPSRPLESDERPEADGRKALERFKMAMRTRPRSGEDLILRPRSQVVRMSCHNCETPFVPAERTECVTCQHTRCTLCPRVPAKTERWAMGSPVDGKVPEEEVRMVRAVQRVYKKPRQRVRYTCEQCKTVFVDSGLCRQCGHAKCGECERNPPRRIMAPHDPALVQAVADRLAAYLVPERLPAITAAG
ncbi:hypothetical protein LTR08_006944 [Meristemomyces frigidus]|nr:hypothetical protein LTR08_006944 [Meristemomyces frigidus]